MKSNLIKFAQMAAVGLALTLTLSCSGGDDNGGENNPSSSGGSSSPSGGGSSSSATTSGGSSSSVTGSVGTSSSAGGGAASETVVIGGKTWQAKNLAVNVTGSKCYDEGALSDAEVQANCAKYGRLYDWATAMALPSRCNRTLSTSDADCAIRTPNHQGICPNGWHIPSNADWDALYRSADGTSGADSPYESLTAGKNLKAREGWTDCGPSGSGKANLCEDTKAFSALPGGFGDSDGNFIDAGSSGYWWSASEFDSHGTYYRYMGYDDEGAIYEHNDKSALFSVRCLQN